MREYNYNFHNILKVRIIKENAYPIFDQYLDSLFAHYATTSIENPDLTIIIADFKPSLEGCYLIDNKYYLKENYIYYSNQYKTAHWGVEIAHLAHRHTTVRIRGNVLSRLLFPGATIYSLLRFKFHLAGYQLLHASSVGKNSSAFLFTGRGGSGKTLTALRFLQRGYRCYADDTVLVKDNKVYSFVTPLNLRFTYNVEDILGVKFNYALRSQIYAKKLLSLCTLKRINLFTLVQPDIYCHQEVGDSCQIKDVFIFLQGKEFALRKEIAPQEGLRSLWLNTKLEMKELLNCLSAYSYFFPKSTLCQVETHFLKGLESSLSRVRFHRVILPVKYTECIFEKIYNEVDHECKRL